MDRKVRTERARDRILVGVNWMDVDGSITGIVGAWIVSNNAFAVTNNCTFNSAWYVENLFELFSKNFF